MVKPTYQFWAPWIGTNTRANDLVSNTEYKKCHKITEQDVSDPSSLPSYSEEDLLDMMNFAQVKLIAQFIVASRCFMLCSFVSQFMNAGKCASKALWPNGSKTDLQADEARSC